MFIRYEDIQDVATRRAFQEIETLFNDVDKNVFYEITQREIDFGLVDSDINNNYPETYQLRYGENTERGVTDVTNAIQTAIDVLEFDLSGGNVQLDSGLNKFTQLTVEQNGITLDGHSPGGNAQGADEGTTLISTFAGDVITLGVSGGGRWNIGLKNLRIDISGESGAGAGTAKVQQI